MQLSLNQKVREDLSFSLDINEGVSQAKRNDLVLKLKQYPAVKEVRYISSEEAIKELESELGENPTSILGYNPLKDYIMVHLKAEYTSKDSLPQVEGFIESLDQVENLSYRSDMFSMVDQRMSKISLALLLFVGLLLLIALIQINNTTQIMIYSKRFLIRSMSLLGAKRFFICRPFIRYSVVNGLFGGMFALLFLAGSLWISDYYLHINILSYSTQLHLIIIGITLPLIGIILSALVAYFATRRYIRMDLSKITLS